MATLKHQLLVNEREVARACAEILSNYPSVIGFDTESTVRKDGSIGSIGLIQLAVAEDKGGITFQSPGGNITGTTTVYLISTASFGKLLPESLQKLLGNQSIKKVCCDLRQDSILLKHNYGIQLRGGIDLKEVAESIGIVGCSLDKISRLYLGVGKVEFDHLKANWDDELTTEQLYYASMDAMLSLQAYLAMFKPVPTPMVEQPLDELEAEGNLLLEFLKQVSFKGNRKPTPEILERMTMNGYQRWKTNYRPQQVKELFQSYFKALLEQKKLFIHPVTFEVSLETPTIRPQIKLENKKNPERNAKIRRQLSINPEGISRASFIKTLINSYTHGYAAEQKEGVALAIFESLLEEKEIELQGEKVRLVKVQ